MPSRDVLQGLEHTLQQAVNAALRKQWSPETLPAAIASQLAPAGSSSDPGNMAEVRA